MPTFFYRWATADALDASAAPGDIDLGILSGFAQQVTAEQDLAVKIGKPSPLVRGAVAN